MRGLGLFLTLCAAVPALAQDLGPLPLVGVLRINSVANNEPTATLLREELAARGDIDGKNIRLDFRLAEGDAGRLPELAEALVREKATVIIAQGPAAALAAQRATRSIPNFAAGNDLVALGLVESMPRPCHNITGVSLLITELDAKRLEVLKEILPAARQFDLLKNPATRSLRYSWLRIRSGRSPASWSRQPRAGRTVFTKLRFECISIDFP